MKRLLMNRRGAAVAGLSAALLVPLGVFGAPALARTAAAAAQYQYSSSAQYQYRVQLCHRTRSKKHPAHTITVSSAAVAAHLRHGDQLGPCSGTEAAKAKQGKGKGHVTPLAPTAPTPTSPGTSEHGGGNNGGGNVGSHGNSGGHGNSGTNGTNGNGGSNGNAKGHGHGKSR